MKWQLSILFLIFFGQLDAQITATYVNEAYYINQMDMCEDTLIVVGVDGKIFKSFDYGKTFTQLADVPLWPTSNCFDFQVVNNRYYYIGARSGGPNYPFKIFKSADYGQTWQVVFSRNNFINTDFLMVDTLFGLALEATFDTLWQSVGSDTNWQKISVNAFAGGNSCTLNFNDSIAGLFRGGAVYLTSDRGQNWQYNSGGAGIINIPNGQYVSKDTVYLVGNSGQESESEFVYSYDGGETTAHRWLGYDYDINMYSFRFVVKDLYFIDSKKGYLFGSYNDIDWGWAPSTIIFTQDFGQTFEPLYTGYTERLYKVVKANDSILVMGGENGIILNWNMNEPLGYLNLPEQNLLKSIKIYPNPMVNQTQISLPQAVLPVNLKVYNQMGQLVFSKQVTTTTFSWSKNNLPNGIYMVVLQNEKGTHTEKLVVE